MSHFTAIQTQIKHTEHLLKALADLGFKQVEVHETAQHLFGFRGDVRSQTAEVIIRRHYIGAVSNDIGFKQQADGSYEAIISEYDRQVYSQSWLNQLTQRYGYHTLMATVPQQGFNVEAEEVMADGTIRVVVGRWT
jgi:Protein of unknown function (DUF1257)